jgi:chromosome transmission fidelity protein 4
VKTSLIHVQSTARETLLLELARDSLGETLTTDEVSKCEMEMDKEFIQLIQAACKADNIPRAIELTKLLHHTVSLGMASKVAAFYHLIGLQEKIETLKILREEEEEDRLLRAREKRRQWLIPDPLPRALPNAPPPARHDPLQDFVPPPPIYRPGLVRAIPVVETTRYPSANEHQAAAVVDTASTAEDTLGGYESVTPDGKRKRTDHDELHTNDDDHAKRRVIDEPVVTTTASSEPSPCSYTQ